MVTINIPLDERTWRRLRDIAEEQRTRGRASVSGVILRVLEDWFARTDAGQIDMSTRNGLTITGDSGSE
jgi:hypothetical protein